MRETRAKTLPAGVDKNVLASVVSTEHLPNATPRPYVTLPDSANSRVHGAAWGLQTRCCYVTAGRLT
jgi:hypothetical protein